MIVLDEQLKGRGIEHDIAQWYRGAVLFVDALRPKTIVKDEAIPMLLRQQREPTFVTINEKDFWLKLSTDEQFCVICFPIPDPYVREIPSQLRRTLGLPIFATKTRRMGHIIRVTTEGVSYYTSSDRQVKTLNW